MSVASLDDDMHVITNADEFESFFNVTLYNAIRYLPHDKSSAVQDFIRSYFVASRTIDGVLCSGLFKSTLIQSGALTYSGKRIVFECKALNEIFGRLMTYFAARYELRTFEATKSNSTKTVNPTAASSTTQQAAIVVPTTSIAPPVALDNMDYEQTGTGDATIQEPSEETKQRAKYLDTHASVQKLFWAATTLQSWQQLWPATESKVDHLSRKPAMRSPKRATVQGTLDSTDDTLGGTLDRSATMELLDRPQASSSKKRKVTPGTGSLFSWRRK